MSGVLWTVYLTHFVTHSKDFASWKGFHVDEESIPQFLVWSNIIDLARAKSEALDNIYSLFKQTIKTAKACNAGKRWKTTIGLISKSNYFFTRLQRETSRNFLVTRFMEEMSYVFRLHFFTVAYFHLALATASISHFVTAATKYSSCSSNKKMSPVAFGLPHLLFELFYTGMPVVRTDGLSGGRSVYGHVITKFSRMGGLPNFLTHGAPPALFARESSAKRAHCLSHGDIPLGNKFAFQCHQLTLILSWTTHLLVFSFSCEYKNHVLRFQWTLWLAGL